MSHFQREIERLKRKILALSALVEEQLRLAFRAIETADAEMGRRVTLADHVVDQQEVDVEEECLKLLALYQPVARDLRFIIAVIKIDNELERIGDLASNVGERAVQLAGEEPVAPPPTLTLMAERTGLMLERALDSLVKQDAIAARLVLASDDEVDLLYRDLVEELKGLIRRDLERLDGIVLLFSVARYLERLADHATNIAEEVLYMVEGEISRHGGVPDTPEQLLGLRRDEE
jgi:phosphate transport system protein